MAARRSRRRKGTARRKTRRAATAVMHRNAPKRSRRRGRVSARKAKRSSARRSSFRRNPPGVVGALTEALMNGGAVTVGVVGQNNLVRYVPNILPATMANAPLLNGLIKDVAGIIAGAYTMHKVFGPRRAEFIVAGQTHAAIARVLRTMNVPVLSTSLGEYDPIRGAPRPGMGDYVNGIVRPPVRRALPPGGNNVARLSGVGIYTEGMSSAPGLF